MIVTPDFPCKLNHFSYAFVPNHNKYKPTIAKPAIAIQCISWIATTVVRPNFVSAAMPTISMMATTLVNI